jgi:DNA-directed RNA polymerase subunit K/omega
MKTLVASRGPELDNQKLVSNCNDLRYDLILIAAIRAREIRRQHKESDKYEHKFPIVSALLEVQEGKIDPKKYLLRVK